MFILIIAVWSDIRTTKISNRLILVGLTAGLFFRIWGSGWTGIFTYLVNISIPVILLYLLFLKRALGAGDIKLFSVIGGFLGTIQLVQIIGVSFLAGGMLSLLKIIQLILQKKWHCGNKHFIHFSIAILIAYLTVWRCVFETNCSSGL